MSNGEAVAALCGLLCKLQEGLQGAAFAAVDTGKLLEGFKLPWEYATRGMAACLMLKCCSGARACYWVNSNVVSGLRHVAGMVQSRLWGVSMPCWLPD